MKWFSNHGIGARIQAIEKRPDSRVEFTVWFTFFFIPLIPLSSWRARYAGELAPNGIWDEGYQFTEVTRIHRDPSCHFRTLTNSLLVLGIAIAPIAIMIMRTQGRAATNTEMILVFASAAWPVLLIILIERRQKKLLKGDWGES